MKKLFLTVALTAVCAGAFAQGKVVFVNDSTHVYYMSTDTNQLKQADAALAGLRTPANGLITGSGITLRADLYAGTSAESLALVSTTTMQGSLGTGRQNTMNVDLPTGIPGGVAQFFQVQIRDMAFATAALAQAGHSYFGYSDIFTTIPNAGAGYNSIVQLTSPAMSTWAAGTYVVPGATAGTRGAIMVSATPVPEPTSLALAGLGAASLLIFRRRK
jgi:hypothetical protein